MSNWNPNKDQWGGQYQPVHGGGAAPQYGGPSYAPPAGPPPQTYPSDQKSPLEGGRFTPKKRIHDPIFLVLFIAQVPSYPFAISMKFADRILGDTTYSSLVL
jgi:hypothetical protein